MIPKGLRVLKSKRGYDFCIQVLDKCCDAIGCDNCPVSKECDKQFSKRLDEWKLPHIKIESPKYRFIPVEQKYANTLPILTRRSIVNYYKERYMSI